MDRYVSTKTEGVKGITLQLGGCMDITIKCDSLKNIYSVKMACGVVDTMEAYVH